MEFQDFLSECTGDPNLVFNSEESFGVRVRAGGQVFCFLGVVDFIQEGYHLGRSEVLFQK